MTKTPSRPAPLACIVLAAGLGIRMKSALSKVLHPVAGKPMIGHILDACADLKPERVVVVIAPKMKAVEELVAPHCCVIQKKPLGTGDAVKAAQGELKSFKGDIIVLFGDTPLITSNDLENLRKKRAQTKADIVVAGFTPPHPGAYGRLIMDKKDRLEAIVEYKDATPAQRKVTLCNGGIMLFASDKLWRLLGKLRNDNANKEFYLTDCVKWARKEGWTCAVADMAAESVRGINTRVELAEVEQLMQKRLREKAMLNGATLLDPATTYLSADTKIGSDVTIGPNVFLGKGVVIGDHAEIRAFCHFEQVVVKRGAIIGPFARLRPGAVIGEDAHIGNFVEIKKSEVGAGAKINHLSYIGDASVGAKANVGAGTITCNYDGFHKAQTKIGAGAFIGSNTALVAPVTVGEGAYVGAGSVVSQNVPPDALSVARARQSDIKDWARRYREEKEKHKK